MAASQPLPRHIQISETLIREIASGLLADGTRLPPEREMAGQLGVAVGTLRKALTRLENQGLLDRVQGSGNYVRLNTDAASIYAPFRLETPQGGGFPTANILDFRSDSPPETARKFGLNAPATRIERLRYLDETPVAYESIWLNRPTDDMLAVNEISDSLYEFYRDALGIVISRVEDQVSVDKLPDGATLPSVRVGEVTGYIERRAWDQSDAPVEYSRTWFDATKARFVHRLTLSPGLI